MASGFFSRVGNLWKGFLSLWISDVEKAHPEIAYENAINGMIEKYAQLKKATAAIIRRREDLDQRLAMQNKELAQVDADLNAAIETNQDDLGLVLVQKKNQLVAAIAELRADLDIASKDGDTAKSSLLQVQSEIKKLQAEKDIMLAKMASSQARIRIQEQLEGFSIDAEVKALDGVRDNINNLAAEAKLGAELADTSLDSRLRDLRQKSGDAGARAQLEQLKAAAAQKKSQSQRTM